MNRIIESHHLCIDAVMIDDSMIRMAHIDILSTPLGVRRVCIINNNLLASIRARTSLYILAFWLLCTTTVCIASMHTTYASMHTVQLCIRLLVCILLACMHNKLLEYYY